MSVQPDSASSPEMPAVEPLQMTVLCGFVGAGKSRVLHNVLAQQPTGPLAVLIHDRGATPDYPLAGLSDGIEVFRLGEVPACPQCAAPLERVLSSFSAGVDMRAKAEAWVKTDARSGAPPATLKNMFGGGLGDLGCGHRHPDGAGDTESCDHRCKSTKALGGQKR